MITLTKISETATKITLGWTPVSGAIGYRFQSAATEPKWSHTWDATRSQVTFAKADWYKVEALGVEDAGEYPQVTPPVETRFFADTSPWNVPIPDNPTIVPQSAQWINTLYTIATNININQGAWTPSIFIAKQSDPTQNMINQDGWKLDNVPIPSNLTPSGDSDAHAIILCPWLNRAYDFFSLRKNAQSQWTMHSGVVFRLDGSGWWDGTYSSGGVTGPWAARASGASLLAMIRPEDVTAGRIPHAISMACPKNANGTGSVIPARTSDGIGGSNAAPMGSRFQLNPAFDLNTLEAGDRLIAKALQEFGAYSTDSTSPGAACAIYCESTAHMSSNPYPSSWSNGLPKSLLAQMRVVAPPPTPVYDDRSVFGQPHK